MPSIFGISTMVSLSESSVEGYSSLRVSEQSTENLFLRKPPVGDGINGWVGSEAGGMLGTYSGEVIGSKIGAICDGPIGAVIGGAIGGVIGCIGGAISGGIADVQLAKNLTSDVPEKSLA